MDREQPVDKTAALVRRIQMALEGSGFLVRAMRSDDPGRVLAQAACRGERDPLVDIDARLFVGFAP